MLLFSTARQSAPKKRKRITTVEQRIKTLQKELNMSKFDIVWANICNDVKLAA